ncbi:MAG: hypothetical protein JO287_00945 [Pseudonocardiales bacterium]|nr:hypothetical protein [Pseudonocardiales bacterium]
MFLKGREALTEEELVPPCWRRHPGLRRGEHPNTWRTDADQRLTTYTQLPPNPDRDKHDVDRLSDLHFGFPHLTDETR